MLAAALWPELERNGSVAAYGGLELALGGAIGDGAQRGAAGVLKWLGKGAMRTNLGGAESSSASGFKEQKGNIPTTRGFIHTTEGGLRMRTSAGGTAASSCVAKRVAALGAAALLRRQSTPPCPNTVAGHIHSVCLFAKSDQNLN